jgi:putative membrane protein
MALQLLFRRELAQAWRHIDGAFLLPLALGMGCGLLLSANTVLYALEHAPIFVGSFFIGLVLAAMLLLRGEFTFRHSPYLLLGAGLVAALGWLQPSTEPVSSLGLFVAGAVAISAMLLPGLSGAFILILLGAYETMLTALVTVDIGRIAIFSAGCLVGLMVFSRLLRGLLSRFHSEAYSVIGGLLLGSLASIWPWRVPVSLAGADGDDPMMRLALPSEYAASLGVEAHTWIALGFVGAGLAVVLGLNRLFISINAASASSSAQQK